MHVTLLVPDLFWPRDDGGGAYRELELPAIESFGCQQKYAISMPFATAASMTVWLRSA